MLEIGEEPAAPRGDGTIVRGRNPVSTMSRPRAKEYDVAGKQLRCVVCDATRFWEREAQLNTAAATFFGFDWANAKATCMVCDTCGYVHWFLPAKGTSSSRDSDIQQELAELRQDLEALGDLQPEQQTRDEVLSG